MRPALALAAVVLLAGCAVGDDGDQRPEATGESLIAFSSKRDGDFDVYVMGPNGTEVRQLTRNDADGANEADDDRPVWSPDGTRLAFLSTRDHTGDSDEDRELYRRTSTPSILRTAARRGSRTRRASTATRNRRPTARSWRSSATATGTAAACSTTARASPPRSTS